MSRSVFAVLILVAVGCTSAPNVSSPAAPSVTVAPVTTSVPTTAPVTPEADQALITYEWYADGNDYKSVFVARPDGSDARAIATGIAGEQRGPTWSPDGQRIAFTVRYADDIKPAEIWLSDADGSNATRLFDPSTSCSYGAFWPAWSPDGSQLSLVCYWEGPPAHASEAVVDVATGDVTKLFTTEWPNHLDNPASWSPDGKTIAFDVLHWDSGDEFLDGSRIGTIPAVGGDVSWLTEMDSFGAWPDWHPTDDLIAYNTYDLGNMHEIDQPSNIWTMRADGSDARQLSKLTAPVSSRVATARWLPDGTRLVASCAFGNPVFLTQVCYVDPITGETSDPVHILSGARPDMRPTL